MLIIKIQNDGTGTEKIGNYRYEVLINNTVIECGGIANHIRNEGWQKLIGMLLANSWITSRERPE